LETKSSFLQFDKHGICITAPTHMNRSVLVTSLFVIASIGEADDRLDDLTRHQEWVAIRSQDLNLKGFLVYPEVSHPTAAVIVIHENRGLTDWARTVADRLAEEGYLAFASDLLSARAPNGRRDGGFSVERRCPQCHLRPRSRSGDDGLECNRRLPGRTTRHQWGYHGIRLLLGGSQSFRFATNRPDLAAAFVFYGRTPGDNFELINCPVYGFYGGDDTRINAIIPITEDVMIAQDTVFEPLTYHEAGHAFMRKGEDPAASDRQPDRDERGLGSLAGDPDRSPGTGRTRYRHPFRPAISGALSTRVSLTF
jgi:carboxymethylenebutenolidase